MLSTALNSNAINIVAGLLVPASITGLGLRSGQGLLTAGWYAGLTVLALVLAYRGRGGWLSGAVIIGGYLAFVTALAVTVAQGAVRPAVAVVPAVVVAVTGAVLLARPLRRLRAWCAAMAELGGWWRGKSLLPGWSTGRLWGLSLALCLAVAAADAASGPHLILIGLLICGPCCALLTARRAPTAASGCVAVALGVVLGVPDQIFATLIQYAFVAAVAVVAAIATAGAAVLQRRGHP